jgi:hypothetical protein
MHLQSQDGGRFVKPTDASSPFNVHYQSTITKTMEDYYSDGFNAGYGQSWRNQGHEAPQSDGDRYSYRTGQEEGERRREISRELDRELYGE